MNIAEILEQKGLDSRQREAVFSDRNTVVSAGAGSGKTTVLSYRFLRLVMEEKATVDSILTLTFTRKAAAEMYERIHSMLIAHRDDPVVAKNLPLLERAQISTLDSFCTQVVRSDCRRYGYAASFLQDEEALREMAGASALSFIHAELQDPAMQHLLALHSFTGVYEHLLVPIALYHMCPSRTHDYPAACAEQYGFYHREYRILEDALISRCSMISELNGKGATFEKAWAFSSEVRRLIDETDDFPLLYEAVSSLPLPRKSGAKPSAKNPDLPMLNELIGEVKETILPTYLVLLNLLIHEEQAAACYTLIGRFQDEFMARKRSAGLLSFADIAQMAVDILTVNLPLRDYYKKRFSHIMIDEFQDNNDLQRKLLYLLSEREDCHAEGIPAAEELSEGKLFFVGDEKQSIYRFRGADVSVFKHLSSEISRMGGSSLSLDTNYRSEPGLIESFNLIFENIMGDAQADFEAEFEPLSYRGPREGIHPGISLLIREGTDKEKSDGEDGLIDDSLISEDAPLHDTDIEAWHIAREIRRIVSDGTKTVFDGASGEVRPVRYDDIAILMRSLSNQMRFEKALRGLNIPFNAQTVRALFLEAPLNDIYQLLQLIVYPTDRHAFAALMRSPFVHLDDDLLFRMLSGAKDFHSFDPSFDDLFGDGDPAWERYCSARELYEGLLALAGAAGKAELVEYLWYEGGYRYFLMNHVQNHRYLEYFEYARELALQSDRKGESLAEFLDGIRVHLGSSDKVPDIELLKTDNSGVKLLTIHKSKGLEFPVVFVVNMGNKGLSDTEEVLSLVSEFSAPVITCAEKTPYGGDYFFLRDKELRKQVAAAELKRLLYVAMTRAEGHLYLSGCWKAPGKQADPSVPRNLLDLVLDGFSLDRGDPTAGQASLELPQSSSHVEVELRSLDSLTEREVLQMRSGKAAAYESGRTAGLYTEAGQIIYTEHQRTFGITEKARELEHTSGDGVRLQRIASDRFLSGDAVPAFGTYCHALIEAAMTGADEEVSLPGELGELSPAQQATLKEDARLLTGRFLASRFLTACRSEGDAVIESEVPFMMQGDKGELLRGVIDLVIETPREVSIIDFKTDSVRYPQAHQYQLQQYAAAYSRYTGKPARGRIWYLREEEDERWDL